MIRISTDRLVRLGGLLLIAVFAAAGGAVVASQQTDAATAGTTKIVARRIVVNSSNSVVPLLTIPGLGELFGKCGSDIAETLFITEKTAGVHVSNILAKMGVRTRTEAAALGHRLALFAEPEGRS